MTDSLAPILVSAMLIGALGSVHCLAMCGGIAGALGQALPGRSPSADFLRMVLYSVGRVSSYAVAGAVFGGVGEAFSRQTGLAVALRVLAGLMILGFGAHTALGWQGLSRLDPLGQAAWRRLAPLAKRIGRPDRSWKVLLLGMLWGWLPCGLVYSALVAAAATGRADSGALFMLCFGFGTMPSIVLASALASRLAVLVARRSTRRVAGIILLCAGVWTIAGALMPLMHHESEGSVPHHHSALQKTGPDGPDGPAGQPMAQRAES